MAKQFILYKIYGSSMLPIRMLLENIKDHLSEVSSSCWMVCTVDLYDELRYDDNGVRIIEEFVLQDNATHDWVTIRKYPDMGDVDMTISVPKKASVLCRKLAEVFISGLKLQRPEVQIKIHP